MQTKDQLASRNKKHVVLLNKIVEGLNANESNEYQKETLTFFNPAKYTKQKNRPFVGLYEKVKLNESKITLEVELKLDNLIQVMLLGEQNEGLYKE